MSAFGAILWKFGHGHREMAPQALTLRLCAFALSFFVLAALPVGGDFHLAVFVDADGYGSVAVGSGVFDASLA